MSPIIDVPAFQCLRCGWIWLSREYLKDRKTIPIACARCKSPYFNREPIPVTNKPTKAISSNKKKNSKKKE